MSIVLPEHLRRFTTPTRVLDHGHVTLVDVYGDDERVEAAARLSYEGQRARSSTRNLLRYLLRQRHTSPFEQCCITLDIRMPIFVARQLVRHRTAKLNEVSGRYTELPADFYVPRAEDVCYQATDNKQGRSGPLPVEEAEAVRAAMREQNERGFELYQRLLAQGVAKETARMHLPLATYTHWWWTMDLHNLLHFLELRMDPHAQWEIREYAGVVAGMIREWVPVTHEAFVDYALLGHRFSRQELAMLRAMIHDGSSPDVGWVRAELAERGASAREIDVFLRKLEIRSAA
jgi:thymidylate synthase (FAD)